LTSAGRDTTTPFAGRTALVTGGGGGIGGAIASALAERGATVGLVGRRRAGLKRVAATLAGEDHAAFVVDLTDDAEVRGLARTSLRALGRLDVLVHSNGIHLSGPLDEARLGDFDKLWAANVRSPFLLTQRLVPALRESKGQIVFVNSSVGLGARAGVGQFSATQHALVALADTFRIELNDDGVRVLSVHPGRTATDRARRIFESEGRPYLPEQLLQPEDVAAMVAEALALPRTAEVTDLRVRSARKH
jgi:NAD(P)-dependent dehydrogenase (short-subunit alcohol dehydrogenase family)